MKKLLIIVLVIMLVGCSIPTKNEGDTVQITGYCKTPSIRLREPDAAENETNTAVGNYGSSGSYALMTIPDNVPDGGIVDSAILRLVEYSNVNRGINAVTAKVSAVTGAWDMSTKWDTMPAFENLVFGASTDFDSTNRPTSSHYDFKITESTWHPAVYKRTIKARELSTDPWLLINDDVITSSQYNSYYSSYGGVDHYETDPLGVYYYWWYHLSYTAGYYTYSYTYCVYHYIDITDVIQSCIDNGYTSIIVWFDLPGVDSNVKYFYSPSHLTQSYRPQIVMNVRNIPIQVASVQGSINKSVRKQRVAKIQGAIDTDIVGMQTANVQGEIDKTVY